MHDIGAVHQAERLAHIVVGDQDADTPRGEVAHQFLDVADGDRVDAGEGLVQQHEGRARGDGTRDFDAPPLAAGERDGGRTAHAIDVELVEQRVEIVLALLRVGLDHLEHGANIVLDIHAAEDRGLLRQVADAEPRAPIHGKLGHVVAVELDAAGVDADQPGDHVEHRGLAGAVGPEQTDRLAALQIDAHVVHDAAAAVAFHKAERRKHPLAAERHRHGLAARHRAGLGHGNDFGKRDRTPVGRPRRPSRFRRRALRPGTAIGAARRVLVELPGIGKQFAPGGFGRGLGAEPGKNLQHGLSAAVRHCNRGVIGPSQRGGNANAAATIIAAAGSARAWAGCRAAPVAPRAAAL